MSNFHTLIARVEAATGPDRELDAAIWRATVPDARHWPDSAAMLFTSSIDAALTLATGEVIERTGGVVAILRRAIDMMSQAGESITALPRFICIAALRAKGFSDAN